MRRILSLDIGITTGYAVLAFIQDEWTLWSWGQIKEDDYQDTLGDLLHQYKITTTVIERPVIIRGQLGDRLARLVVATETLVSPLTTIQAADWKPSPYAKLPTPKGTSTHEKDAIRIGYWFAGRL